MKKTIPLLIGLCSVCLFSCTVSVPMVNYEQKKEDGSKLVSAAWSSKPSIWAWATPVILGGLVSGSVYAIPTNKETKALIAPAGLGIALYGIVFIMHGNKSQKDPKYFEQIKPTERDRWVKKYNKKEKLHYVLEEVYPDGNLYLKLTKD